MLLLMADVQNVLFWKKGVVNHAEAEEANHVEAEANHTEAEANHVEAEEVNHAEAEEENHVEVESK